MGKGSNTTTTQSSPNPFATNAYLNLLARADSVGSQPYQPYQGDLVASVNAQQTAGINSINQNAGFAQPFIDQAHGFATQAAQPITGQDIAQYQSPYTQQVVDATSNWFNTQNQQQQENLKGNAAAQGALGGDRLGVAQANLANLQTQSQAPIISGLYNTGFQNAVQAAQRQQANLGNAAYSIGNLGVAGQNAGLTGANAQIGAGNLQQQNQQQLLNARYGQFQIGQAFPYQQTQWLAGLDTGVGSQLGGQSSTTAPPPNQTAQWAGLGLAGASMFLKRGGRIPGFAPGGSVDEGPFSGVGWIPVGQITRGAGAPKPPSAPGQQQAAATKPMDFGGRYSGIFDSQPLSLAPDGVAGFSPSAAGSTLPMGTSPEAGFGFGPIYQSGGAVRGYDDGGAVDDPTFADRWSPVADAVRSGDFDPTGLNSTPTYTAGFGPQMAGGEGFAPVPRPRPWGADALPGEAPLDDGDMPEGVLAFGPGANRPTQPLSDENGAVPFAPTGGVAGVGAPERRGFNLGLLPDNLRGPLLAAGLGMLASRSPNLGNAIGEGGLAGVNAYNQAKERDLTHAEKQQGFSQQNRRIDLEAKRLDAAARRAREDLDLRTKQFKFQQDKYDVPQGYRKLADGKLEPIPGGPKDPNAVPEGYRKNEEGVFEPLPGGPQDPAVVKALADAKRGTAGLLDQETIQTMAGQYLSGDKSVMQNLGRGAQGAENIVKLRAEITRQAKDEGLSPSQIGTRMADFAGRTAAMRTLGTRGANVEYAGNTAANAIKLAEEASDKLPRTQFVPFNRLAQMVATNTSSPEQADFFTKTNTLVNEYARVTSGGTAQSTESQRTHARELLNTAQGPAAYKAVLNAMKQEIAAAKKAYSDTRKEFLGEGHAVGGDKPGAGGAEAAPKVGERKQFKQGWGTWNGTAWIPEKP